MCKISFFYILLFLFCFLKLGAIPTDSIRIDSIILVGNEKTKDWVILQEARIETGTYYSIKDFNIKLQEINVDLQKTNLFSKVEVSYILDLRDIYVAKIVINLEEAWLLFPSVIFELADRNFNVWWKEHDHSFNRINLGLKLYHYNFTGRNDRIKLRMHAGYTQRYDISYEYPYINKARNLGLRTGIFYTQSKEINIQTIDNKYVLLENKDAPLYNRWEASVSFRYRPGRTKTYVYSGSYNIHQTTSFISEANPEFFLDKRTQIRYTSMEADYLVNTQDLIIRPKRGYLLRLAAKKEGIPGIESVNNLYIGQEFGMTQKIAKKLYYNLLVRAKEELLRNKPPYFIYKGLGSKELQIKGYQHYVIDGSDLILFENYIRRPLFSYQKALFKILKGEPRLNIKLDLDLIIQGSMAYVNDPFYSEENFLSNTWLYSGGAGIDIVVNDAVRVEVYFAANHLKETGIFINTKSTF
ncbi:MAG: hypothetical protein M3Q56_00255 [Bacteroidota bacterium]|nr:hypothetical protein [Bacteroidota bacterium]